MHRNTSVVAGSSSLLRRLVIRVVGVELVAPVGLARGAPLGQAREQLDRLVDALLRRRVQV